MERKAVYDGPKEVVQAARVEVERNTKKSKESEKVRPTHIPSSKFYDAKMKRAEEVAAYCKHEIKEAERKLGVLSRDKQVQLKIKLCIRLLHKVVGTIGSTCPKAQEILKTLVQYIYPTPQVQNAYESMRRDFVKGWKAAGHSRFQQGEEGEERGQHKDKQNTNHTNTATATKTNSSPSLSSSSSPSPSLAVAQASSSLSSSSSSSSHEAKELHKVVSRQPFVLLAKRLKAFEKSLYNRLSRVKKDTKIKEGNYASRFKVVNRALQRWRERTKMILFRWWLNTAKHSKARRRAFQRFVGEREQRTHIHTKKLMFYRWRTTILNRKLHEGQVALVGLIAEKKDLRANQVLVREDLRVQYKEVKKRTKEQQQFALEEEEVKANLERRQRQLLEAENADTMSPAVLIVSQIRIIICTLRVVESLSRKLEYVHLQDPLLLLCKEHEDVRLDPLYKIPPPVKPLIARFSSNRTANTATSKRHSKGRHKKKKSIPCSSMPSSSRLKSRGGGSSSRKAASRLVSRQSTRTGRGGGGADSPVRSSSSTLSSRASSSPQNSRPPSVPQQDANANDHHGNEQKGGVHQEDSNSVASSRSVAHKQHSIHELSVTLLQEKIDDITQMDTFCEVEAKKHYEKEVKKLEDNRDGVLSYARKIFESMSDAELSLLWLNYHVSNSRRKSLEGSAEAFDAEVLERKVHNFTSDFQDCEVLGRLLNELVPNVAPMKMIESVDLYMRAKRIKEVLNELSDPSPNNNIAKSDDQELPEDAASVENDESKEFQLGHMIQPHLLIRAKSKERLYILVLKLFADFPTIEVDSIHAHGAINHSIDRWVQLTKSFANPRQGAMQKLKMVREMNEEVIGLLYSTRMYMRDIMKRDEMWTSYLQPRLWKACLSNLHMYMRDVPIHLEDPFLKQAMERDCTHYETLVENGASVRPVQSLQAYLNFTTENVMHLGQSERMVVITKQMIEVKKVLINHYFLLRRVHRHYAQTDADSQGTTTMNLSEYWSFVTDCGMLHRFQLFKSERMVHLLPATVLKIFGHVAETNNTLASNVGPGARFKFIQEYEMELKLFIQCVILIAVKCAGSNIHRLSSVLNALITKLIKPSSLIFDNEDVRGNMKKLEVFRVFHRYRKYTLRVFYTYSVIKSVSFNLKDSVGHEKWKETIDFEEFYQFCENAGYVHENLSKKQLYYIFSSVQQEAFEMNGDSAAELTFPEFLEALSAIALFKRPLPYESVTARIEKFLRIDFLPWVRKTLVVADPAADEEDSEQAAGEE
mmetsp:Transcript_12088/g.24299  ORF Transcript_12088/g.24299 Transcript_12088/m.24299 type:complete len:1265 (-) Transcript_12088:207-4001(-)|eukprot:CAMPEP_0167812180 /NCGR_PEP_ID=MMETSP0112_2-20121227/1100_1 /TAXON_ID=91324 /ORGANISM="Lotharella globosa, Strain CCCM811" /LENGTH=1264 /DNA_ID=CAMNT_0007711013 /DNA_START=1132 /DNA_END=4926 /DNA_ORIENTATION=-